jgi:hypothetical protein
MNIRASGSTRRLAAIAAVGLLAASGCTGEKALSRTSEAAAPAKKFIVMLEGRNYIFDRGGQPTPLGFFATKHVIASDANAAERAAVREVQDDEKLNASIVNAPSDPPRVTVTRHIEVDSFAADSSPNLGYIFYEDRDSNR